MNRRSRIFVVWTLLAIVATARAAQAGTLVAFNFAGIGTVHFDLFDDLTPVSVTNFLGYVNSDAYDGTVIHRSTDKNNPSEGFGVIQGGGFKYSDATQTFTAVNPGAQIQNEFARANTRGTIAMARSTGLNTATNQWFINTSDNSAVFSAANPYAVFGWVVGPGMDTIDYINSINAHAADGMVRRNLAGSAFYSNGNFQRMPIARSYSDALYNALVKPTSSQMAVLTSVSVVSVHADYQNAFNIADVDNNNLVQPLDALTIINEILDHNNQPFTLQGPFSGSGYLDPGQHYIDPSGDDIVNQFDVLLVINQLIQQSQAPLSQSLANSQASLTSSPLSAASVLVPEPSSLALASLGVAALLGGAVLRWRRRRVGSHAL